MSPCDEQRITTVPCRVMKSLQRARRSFDTRSAKPMMLWPFHSSRRSGSRRRAGVVARGKEAGTEAADLATNQVFFATVRRAQHDIGLAPARWPDNGWVMISSCIWPCSRRNVPSRGISQCAANVAPIDSLTMPRACAPVADSCFGAQRRRRHGIDVFAEFAPLGGQRKTFVGSRKQGNAELVFQLAQSCARPSDD